MCSFAPQCMPNIENAGAQSLIFQRLHAIPEQIFVLVVKVEIYIGQTTVHMAL